MTFNEPGLYQLSYKATDPCGNESYVTRQITVEAEPPQYPYTLATIGQFSNSGGTGPIRIDIPNVVVLEKPRQINEWGSVLYKNFVYDGVNYGDITDFVEVSQLNEFKFFVPHAYFSPTCSFNDDLSVISCYGTTYNDIAPFSWDSATIIIEGVD